MPQAWITETRLDIIARLGTAIAAADDASPLKGLRLPANRWTRFAPQDLPAMFVRVARLRRQGIASNVPLFELAADIEVHAAVAALENDAASLDARIEAILDDVDVVLLEDADFVKRFTAVTAGDVEFEDGEGSDRYVRLGVVTYTVTVEQEFVPRVPDALRQVQIEARHAPVPGGEPGELHGIPVTVDLPQV